MGKNLKMLYISGYDAWEQISNGIKPSHHMFGVHELIDHYEKSNGGELFGVLKSNVIPGYDSGRIDFYIWESSRKDVLKHIKKLLHISSKYDLVYDCLNRCSMWIGPLKKLKIFKPLIITTMHHPSFYKLCLNVSGSDAYIFFNENYRNIALQYCARKKNRYYVNEWYPDSKWYEMVKDSVSTDAFYLDNGKSERDRQLMIDAAEKTKIRVDYASNENQEKGYARGYKMKMDTYVGMTEKTRGYKSIVIPIRENKKFTIGPLGITSFLDCMALDIPVVTSNNTCFAEDVEKYTLGCSYETGNMQSLEQAMKKLYNDRDFYMECSENMQKYSTGKTIEKYSANLIYIINEVLRNN